MSPAAPAQEGKGADMLMRIGAEGADDVPGPRNLAGTLCVVRIGKTFNEHGTIVKELGSHVSVALACDAGRPSDSQLSRAHKSVVYTLPDDVALAEGMDDYEIRRLALTLAGPDEWRAVQTYLLRRPADMDPTQITSVLEGPAEEGVLPHTVSIDPTNGDPSEAPADAPLPHLFAHSP